MRVHAIALCVFVATTAIACSKSADSSSTAASPGAAVAASAPIAAGTARAASSGASPSASEGVTNDDNTGLPYYPGSTVADSTGKGGSSETTITSGDSLEKVNAWYRSHMPASSEKAQGNFMNPISGGYSTINISGTDGNVTIRLNRTIW